MLFAGPDLTFCVLSGNAEGADAAGLPAGPRRPRRLRSDPHQAEDRAAPGSPHLLELVCLPEAFDWIITEFLKCLT